MIAAFDCAHGAPDASPGGVIAGTERSTGRPLDCAHRARDASPEQRAASHAGVVDSRMQRDEAAIAAVRRALAGRVAVRAAYAGGIAWS